MELTDGMGECNYCDARKLTGGVDLVTVELAKQDKSNFVDKIVSIVGNTRFYIDKCHLRCSIMF